MKHFLSCFYAQETQQLSLFIIIPNKIDCVVGWLYSLKTIGAKLPIVFYGRGATDEHQRLVAECSGEGVSLMSSIPWYSLTCQYSTAASAPSVTCLHASVLFLSFNPIESMGHSISA